MKNTKQNKTNEQVKEVKEMQDIVPTVSVTEDKPKDTNKFTYNKKEYTLTETGWVDKDNLVPPETILREIIKKTGKTKLAKPRDPLAIVASAVLQRYINKADYMQKNFNKVSKHYTLPATMEYLDMRLNYPKTHDETKDLLNEAYKGLQAIEKLTKLL